jgi:hypothetical protein
MATFTFRVGDDIFIICSLKDHMTRFLDFWSKILQLIILESPAEIIENTTFNLFQLCPRFVSSRLFIL